MKDNSGKIMLALLAGASAGVIAGLLMAPDSGTATRDSLKKSASKLGKDLEKKLQEGMSRLEGMNAGGLIDQASSMLGMNKGSNSDKTGVNGNKGGSTASGSSYTSGSGSSSSGSGSSSGSSSTSGSGSTSGAGSSGSTGGGAMG